MKVKDLLLCGAVAGPLFVLAFLVEGATRADYDPVRHPVSSLALGDYGWTQTINFLVTGALVVAYAIGLRKALKPGKASLFAPIFVVAFFTLPIACWVMVRRFISERRWGWAAYSFVTPIVFLVLFVLSGKGFSQEDGFVDVAGAYQRACVTVGFAWLTLLALHMLSRVPATDAAGTPG